MVSKVKNTKRFLSVRASDNDLNDRKRLVFSSFLNIFT